MLTTRKRKSTAKRLRVRRGEAGIIIMKTTENLYGVGLDRGAFGELGRNWQRRFICVFMYYRY